MRGFPAMISSATFTRVFSNDFMHPHSKSFGHSTQTAVDQLAYLVETMDLWDWHSVFDTHHLSKGCTSFLPCSTRFRDLLNSQEVVDLNSDS